MATIYEVAKKSGVSIGTVSRVLNDSPLTASATRERVLQVMDELDYQPDAMAQGLARRKTNAIGVIVPLFESRGHVEVLRGIQRTLAQHNLDLILYGIDDLQKKDAFLRRALQQRRVDGMLLVGMPLSGALAVDCKRRRLPLVLADSYHHQFDSIFSSYQEGALLAAQYLKQLGPHRYAIFDGDCENIVTRQRLQACQRALQEAGVALSDQILIKKEAPAKGQEEAANQSPWHSSYSTMKSFLRQQLHSGRAPESPLAIFLAGEVQETGALQAVQEANLRLPQEIVLVNVDESAALEHAGVITVRSPKAEIGQQAAKRLLALLKNPALPVQHVALKPQLRKNIN